MADESYSPELKYPWQKAVLDAFLEFDPDRLVLKVGVAERTISARLRDHNHRLDLDEELALHDALRSLQVLFNEASERAKKAAGKKETA
jgi:hypothetical protein